MSESSTAAPTTSVTSSAATQTVTWRNKRDKWYKKRNEQKQVLEQLRKIVPFVNEHTPQLELLQKVIDYITDLQVLFFIPRYFLHFESNH